MRTPRNSPFSARASARLLFSFLLLGPIPVVTSFGQQPPESSASVGKTRSMAATQHEIVMLLIRKKEFDKAVTEACKIFDMSWPASEEPLLLTELRTLSAQFQNENQPAAALKLIDTNMKSFKSVQSQIWIWKEKGYLFKKMGDNDRSLECFRTAMRLEESKPK